MRLTSNGDFAVVEQDDEIEVAQHAIRVLLTRQGSRELDPSMGLEDTTHRMAVAGDSHARRAVEEALNRHAPRVEYHAVAAGAEPLEWIDAVAVEIGVKQDG